jgi:pyruvate/2-oxoglutarate dehydrogenase complex dihydrolipoamide acyltransferase (E2) component
VDIEVKGEVPADAQIAATGEIAPPQVPSTAPELAQDTALHQGPGAVQGISAGDQHPHHTGKMAGGVAEVGQKAAGIARQAVAAVASTAAAAASAVMGGAPGSGGSSTTSKVLASPAVRRMAREAGVDLEALAASCPGGRVRQEDVQRWVARWGMLAGQVLLVRGAQHAQLQAGA